MPKIARRITGEKKHRVTCRMQVLELTRAGSAMELKVYGDGELLGKIIIGQGSLTWQGAKRQYCVALNWSQFAELMDRQYDA
jgi:hypothetical protein